MFNAIDGVIGLRIHVNVDADRLSKMSPDQIRAFFAGVAAALGACGQNVTGQVVIDDRNELRFNG